MAYIRFLNSEDFVAAVVKPADAHVVRITADNLESNISGFRLYLQDNDEYPMDNREYEAYTTVYREGEGWFELSNDGSVYEEPTIVIPEKLTEEQKAELEKQKQISDIQSIISRLKAQITATDYQIIKTYEYFLVGLETEYDIGALHELRQGLRDQINGFEAKLADLM